MLWGRVAKMRERAMKLAPLAGTLVASALLACVFAIRFAGAAAANGSEEAAEAAQGPSSRFGDERVRLGSYVSTLALGSGSFDGEVYRFSGNRICIEALCAANGNGAEPQPTFSVELYRLDYGLVEIPMGSRTLKSRGISSATWENVRPGEYFFRFTKEDDGCVLRSTNVWMYSYWEE